LEPDGDEVNTDLSFAKRRLNEETKRRRIGSDKYRSTNHILPTSNSCERLFSAARLIMSYLRSNMDCDSCGMLLFLKSNRRFWEGPKLIDEIMLEEKLAAAVAPGIEETDTTDVDGFDDNN